MGLFKKRSTDPAEIEHLKSEIASMGARLDARLDESDTAKSELGAQVQSLTTRLDTPIGPPPTEPPPAPPASVDPAELDELRAKMQRIVDRLDDVDARITSISTELANQISEMSGDIEALHLREQPADEIVGGLRDAQTRLANEQARYQIAFRQDLADLAERLKRA